MGSDSLANITAIESTHTDSSDKVVFKKSVVKKHSESSTSEGFGLVFYDVYDDGQDTISLLIPNPPIIINQSVENDSSDLQKGTTPVNQIKSDTLLQTPIVVAVKTNSSKRCSVKSLLLIMIFSSLGKTWLPKTQMKQWWPQLKNLSKRNVSLLNKSKI